MIILGIDTSCDETSVAILKIANFKLKILSNIISSQAKLHSKYGGVWPSLAKREHKKNLPIVFEKALKEAKIKISDIDIFGITVGPGLEPCLWEGINFLKSITKEKIFPVNHIKAHIFSSFLDENFELLFKKNFIFPAISLVVSGGHTQLILVEKLNKFLLLGETRDDAAGECLDKVARRLGLGYPGGPAIEKLAKLQTKNSKFKIKLPRPMINQKNYDFSFSGLKTAVLYDFLKRDEKERESKEYKIEIAKEVQSAIFDVLVSKTFRAAREFKVKSIILGGGVAANSKLREEFEKAREKEKIKVKLFFPKKEFCTDNGAMVALVAWIDWFLKEKETKEIVALANLRI
jgi:N6-L-threonylcarbamoyladenine synthase